ncbi:MAG: hypothetical protein ACTHOC_07935 [Luteimonas sp.]
MTLQRAQIDVLLQDLEATAWRRHRADPRDPTLSRDIADQARALLRVAAPGEHLHICDCAQHLLLSLDGEAHEARETHAPDAAHAEHAVAAPRTDGILRAVQPTRECVPDLGIALVDDPYDLDAYVPKDAEPAVVRMVPAPQPVRVFAPERRATEAGADARELRRGLTAQQLRTLDTMSHFGWTLCFVRRPMFLPPLPVAFDRNRERFVVVEPDGSIDDAPRLPLRD